MAPIRIKIDPKLGIDLKNLARDEGRSVTRQTSIVVERGLRLCQKGEDALRHMDGLSVLSEIGLRSLVRS